MKLLEFITYCELAGLVKEKLTIPAPEWTSGVKWHQKIRIFSRHDRCRLNITYTLEGDTAVMVENSLYTMHNITGQSYRNDVELSEIIAEFFQSELA